MFSGIRYILGYTDDAPAPASSDATCKPEQKTTDDSSLVLKSETTSTTVLEQTLNAATTKFTEQLLPQQTSIEQLQSSSHQLLPSIIEQHEEDELKKLCANAAQVAMLGKEEEDDDDDINVDSWELLDLVDKVDEDVGAESGLISSSVQKDESSEMQGLSKSASGILKSSGGKTTNDNDNNSHMRQKQKVSFETPDLVKFKQDIEQTKPKEAVALAAATRTAEAPQAMGATVAVSKKLKKKKAKSSKANGAGAASKNENSVTLDVGVRVVADLDKKVCEQKEVTEIKSKNPSETGNNEKEEQSVSVLKVSTAQKVPVLNYAKALAAKPKAGVTGPSGVGTSVVQGKPQLAGTVEASESSGPIKRSRPLSTSSWSSSDDIEPMELASTSNAAKSSSCAVAGPSRETEPAQDPMGDNESLISSGFSDCDYGFSGLNDYIMRPKKVYHKRGQASSGSSSSLVFMKTRRSDGINGTGKIMNPKVAPKGAKIVASETKALQQQQQQPTASSKNNKPKKRRMIMSTSKIVGPTEFLKSKRTETKDRLDSKQAAAAARNGSSESSDIAEMDESWFVTPPPCFTGASRAAHSGKADQPKAKDAARENALIEHPSIYIASTSRDSLKVKFTTKASETVVEASKDSVGEALKSLQVVDKKTAALEDSAWASDDELSDISDTLSLGEPTGELVEDDDDQVQPTGTFDEIRNSEDEEISASIKQELASDENQLPVECPVADVQPSIASKRRGVENIRPPTQVRPIEPERRPGWQLKRQRSKRRSPLKVAGASGKQLTSEPKPSPVVGNSAATSAGSSSRSTPTLMDRIGNSIVANLTNLTSGLVSNSAMNYCPNGRHPSIIDVNPERAHQGPLSIKTNSSANVGQLGRKQMSRGSLKRQNDCMKQGNSLRRPDRRLKMFATPNGCSVNRKVHTSIH